MDAISALKSATRLNGRYQDWGVEITKMRMKAEDVEDWDDMCVYQYRDFTNCTSCWKIAFPLRNLLVGSKVSKHASSLSRISVP